MNGSRRARSCLSARTCAGAASAHASTRSSGVRGVIAATEAGADAALLDQLHRGEKQVLQQAQLLVEPIDRGERRRRVIPHVAQQLPHVRPILLLDVRVIVLLVRAPASELDVMVRAIAAEMVIDELGAVVRIDPAQPKGHGLAQVLQAFLDVVLTLAHHRPRFHPGREDIGHIQ